MTSCDIIISSIIGIVTGFIGGWLSALIVTKYYRGIDEKQEESMNFIRDVRLLAQYIVQVIYEVNSAIRTKTYVDLGRILSKEPRLEGIRKNKEQPEEFIKAFNDMEMLLIDLHNLINSGEIETKDLTGTGNILLAHMFKIVQYKKVN